MYTMWSVRQPQVPSCPVVSCHVTRSPLPALRPARATPGWKSSRVYAEPESSESSSTKVAEQPAEKKADEPAWVRREREQKLIDAEGKDLPFPVFLLASATVAIAAVGSIYEFSARHAVFGVIQPDNPLWAPILGFFSLTGLPLAGYLFFRAVNSANKESERQDRLDGF